MANEDPRLIRHTDALNITSSMRMDDTLLVSNKSEIATQHFKKDQ